MIILKWKLVLTAVLATCAFSQAQKCDEPTMAIVAQCLQPLIELAQRQPESINNHSFPLYHFNATGLREVCKLYNGAKKDCLVPKKLDEICKSQGLIDIFETLFGYPCDPSNEARFFRHFGCAASMLEASSECDDSIRVPLAPTAGWNKCAAIPTFYACLAPKVAEKCGQTAQEILHDSIVAYGCTNVADAKAEGDNIRRRPVSNTSAPAQEQSKPAPASKAANATSVSITANPKVTSPKQTTSKATATTAKTTAKSQATTKSPTTPKMAAKPKTNSTTAKATPKPMLTSKSCQYRSDAKLKECFDTSMEIHKSFKAKVAAAAAKTSGSGKAATTFPLFMFTKPELLAICGEHSAVFLNCRQNVYQKCRDDAEVKIADILLSYGCGQPTAFFKSLACVLKVQEMDKECLPNLLVEATSISCQGKAKFAECFAKLAASESACQTPHNGKTPAQFLLGSVDYYKCAS